MTSRLSSSCSLSPPQKRLLSSPGLHYCTPQRRKLQQHQNVRVVVRIRPLSEQEERRGCQSVLYTTAIDNIDETQHTASLTNSSSTLDDDLEAETPLAANCLYKQLFADEGDDNVESSSTAKKDYPTSLYAEASHQTTKQFDFFAVYGPTISNSDLYSHAIIDLTQSLLQGFNTTIIAYGMTGSGKTYTMSGGDNNNKDDGIVVRAVRDIFDARDTALQEGRTVSLALSCLEIYTEELFDLLATNNENNNHGLKLRDHGDGVTVSGLQSIPVDSMEQVRALLHVAQEQRTVATTALNERSSRSHAVYTLHVVSSSNDTICKAKLTLVDLAGSERIKQSNVQGQQRKESIHINTDLFVLGKVVNSLSSGTPHVPYRDSKLTRLLRDALGGNCRTTLIACVSPADHCADESLNTLRYAERTQSITNAVSSNIILESLLSPAQCAALRAENRVLKERIANILQDTARPLLDDGNNFGLSELQAKLDRARHEAQCARLNCEQMTLQASRLKERYEKLLVDSSADEQPEEGTSTYTIHRLVQESKVLCNECMYLAQQLECQRIDDNDKNDASLEGRLQDLATMIRNNHTNLQRALESLVLDEYNNKNTSADGFIKELDDDEEPQWEIRCEQLHQDMDFVNSENDILRQQNRKLQEEVRRLKEQLTSNAAITSLEYDDDGVHPQPSTVQQEQQQIRSHAEQLLDWADRAIQKGKKDNRGINDSCDSSMVSTFATEFKPCHGTKADEQVLIANLENLRQKASNDCHCQRFLLTSKPEHVDFYLPKLRVMCNCHNNNSAEDSVVVDDDPCLLVNILRDWQVDFLKTMGLHTASDLVRAITTRAKSLSKEMRQWRREQGLLSVRTKSCGIALHIWARTCKAVVRAVRENNIKNGRPAILDFSLMSDDCTVSTLGFCGSITEGRRLSDVEELSSELNINSKLEV